MGVSQCALLRQRGLVALLETAAVSYATENSGDELGIVHVAEAVEQLVLFAEVDVHPGIKRVAALIQFGRVSVIRKESAAVGWQGIEIKQRNGVRIQPVDRQLIQGAVGETVRRGAGRAVGVNGVSDKACADRDPA